MQTTKQHFIKEGDYLFIKKFNILLDVTMVKQVEENLALLDNGDRVANPIVDGQTALNQNARKYYYQSEELNEQFEKNQSFLDKIEFGTFVVSGIITTSLIASTLSYVNRGIDSISYYRQPYLHIEKPCTEYLDQFKTTPVIIEGKNYLAQGLTCLKSIKYPEEATEYQQLQKNLNILKQLPDTGIIPTTLGQIVQKNIDNVNLYKAEYSLVPYPERIIFDPTIILFLIFLVPVTILLFILKFGYLPS